MSEAQELYFKQVIATGNHKVFKKLLAKVDFSISAAQLLEVIDAKHQKMMRIIVTECRRIEITNDVVIGCVKNRWKKILMELVFRKDCRIADLTDNDSLIQIVSLGDLELSRRVLSSKKIDFNGPNAEVMIYICKINDVPLVKHLLQTKNIDPNYDNNVFMKTAILKNSQGVIQLFKETGGYDETREMKMFEYLRTPNCGI